MGTPRFSDRQKSFAIALLFVIATSVSLKDAEAGFEQCPENFPAGRAPAVQFNTLKARELCFDSFAVLHSGVTKTPLYAVEHLNPSRLKDALDEARTDHFYEEARLPASERAFLGDYRGSGFDRGHMAPAADMPNPNAMAQSFSLANIVPQNPENNRKAWANIEKDTRKYVKRTGSDVFVYTGVVFTSNPMTIGKNQVWVPGYLYKLVYDSTKNRAWAYWEENVTTFAVSKPISYRELTNRIGFSLLPVEPN